MSKHLIFTFLLSISTSLSVYPQEHMTPELLWSLGRVSGLGLSVDGKNILYRVKHTKHGGEFNPFKNF